MIVYKIVNTVNNKIYIGVDSKNDPDYLGSGDLIKAAIKKYGKKSFTKETIDKSDSIIELYKKEEYWVKYYNSTSRNIGYNIKQGGLGNSGKWNGDSLSEKHKDNISKGLIKSEKRKNMWEDGHGLKLSIARKKSKKVNDLYKSKAWRKTISTSVKESEKYKKFLKREDRLDILKESLKRARLINSKKVEQYDLHNNFLKEYDSVIEASRQTNIPRNLISRICRNKGLNKKTQYNWKFKNE